MIETDSSLLRVGHIARLPDHELWMAFCHDSEGNLLGLMSEVRTPPPERGRTG